MKRFGISRCLMIGSIAAASVSPFVVGASPAEAALVPAPPGCGFRIGPTSFMGAAGSEYLQVTLLPLNRSEVCTVNVTASASLVPAAGGSYSGGSNNYSTASIALVFGPSLIYPSVNVDYVGHCADPASPGDLTLSVGGQSFTQPVDAQSCTAYGTPHSEILVSRLGYPSSTGLSRTSTGQGYDEVDNAGSITAYGDRAPSNQSPADVASTAIAGNPVGPGYWVAGTDGSVYSYSGAAFHGAATNYGLNKPVVGIAATSDGGGYWLAASDGGVFSFGDAAFYGSAAAIKLNSPVVGIAATPDGGGYWLAAADGGVFSYGDAVFYGSAGSIRLNAPVVGIAASAAGGYWLAAADGGVFSYGPAAFHGSAADIDLNAPISAIASTPDGGGYWLMGADSGIFTYGNAPYILSPSSP